MTSYSSAEINVATKDNDQKVDLTKLNGEPLTGEIDERWQTVMERLQDYLNYLNKVELKNSTQQSMINTVPIPTATRVNPFMTESSVKAKVDKEAKDLLKGSWTGNSESVTVTQS